MTGPFQFRERPQNAQLACRRHGAQSHCLPLAVIGLHQIIGTAEVLTLL